MPPEIDLVSALKRLVADIATKEERHSVREALTSGRLAVATGDRAVAIGGDAKDAIIVTGDGNIVTMFKGLEAAALKLALDRLYPPRLFQLPADLADFTGREEEVDKLLTVLKGGDGKAAISALGGMGGVGKTALAVHVAHKLAPDYPEAQIVVELKGTAQEPEKPLTYSEAMGYVIKAFRPEVSLPDNPTEMADLYCSVLSGKRTLLLLDNARDAAQVRPLLPPAPCGVLVTSRKIIVLPGVTKLDLEVLPDEKAVELLETILGPGRDGQGELPDLAAKCGRLPLALRVAGSFLAGHHDWTVTEYLQELADEKERLKSLKDEDIEVEATLGLSAAQLAREKPDLAARWQMLSVFPASFDRPAAAAVWEIEEKEARDGLSELLSRSLVLFDPEKSRYRLHDLMRPVAGNAFGYGGEEPDREAEQERLDRAAFRHADHYAGVLRAAHTHYLEGGEAIKAGMDLFDAEWDNIRAGQAWAAAHSGEGEAAARLCDDYPDSGVYVLNLRLHPREWIVWLEAALTAARRLKDRAAEGRHLGNLGLAYADLGEPRRAIEFYEKALAVLREIGDRRGEGSVLGNLGNAYCTLGEPRRAIETYEQRLAIDRKIGDRRGEGNALGNLGIAYWSLGEYRRAIEYQEQRLAITREIGDRLGEGQALGNLGLAYAALGEPRRALEFYEQRLAIARDMGDRRGEGTALYNMSLALDELGERNQAIACAEESLKIHEETEDPWAGNVRRLLEDWHRES